MTIYNVYNEIYFHDINLFWCFFFRYLQVEWQTKRGGYRDFSGDHMVGSHCTVPLQDNTVTVAFICYNMQKVFTGRITTILYSKFFNSISNLSKSLFWQQCYLYILKDPVVDFELPLRLERWFPRQQCEVNGRRFETSSYTCTDFSKALWDMNL